MSELGVLSVGEDRILEIHRAFGPDTRLGKLDRMQLAMSWLAHAVQRSQGAAGEAELLESWVLAWLLEEQKVREDSIRDIAWFKPWARYRATVRKSRMLAGLRFRLGALGLNRCGPWPVDTWA